MKTRFSLLLAALCGLASVASLHAQTTAFTYQGRLTTNGGPANGSHDFQFTLFGAPGGGSPVQNPVALSAVGVTNGLFTVLLDFGSDTFTGADRWLDIAVRPAGGGTFTPLTPRQPITPTPYAVTALFAKQVPGVSGNALHAADGNPQNAVFVDNDGKVGVGTIGPVSKLHVTSSVGELSPPRLQSGGGISFNAGWDFYPGGVGKGYVGVPDSAAAFAPGEMLVFGAPGTKVSLWSGGARSLTADTAGNVDVRGGIRMGPNGEVRAAGGEENLRIVRGTVNAQGGIVRGAGFTVFRAAHGDYGITFTTPFADTPVVTASHDLNGGSFPVLAVVDEVAAGSANVVLRYMDGVTPFPFDGKFHFIAIGPR